MDVTCERCHTAYEFDDALVSERGTTVKCTSCGHQFKVRRPQPAGAPERWLVRTIDGRELEFRALRELQTAIAQAQITRDDVLSRGGSRPRRLGSIAELEPFFASVGAGSHATTLGLGPKAPLRSTRPSTPGPTGSSSRPEVSVAIPLPGGTRGLPDEDSLETMAMQKAVASRLSASAPSRRAAPVPGVVIKPAGAPPIVAIASPPLAATVHYGYGDATTAAPYNDLTRAAPDEAQAAADDAHAKTTVGTETVDDAAARDVAAPAPQQVRDDWSHSPASGEKPALGDAIFPPASGIASSRPEPGPPVSTSELSSGPIYTPAPAALHHSVGEESYAEPRFSAAGSTRRAGAARWIVGFVIGGMFALAGATIGRKVLVTGAPVTSRTGEVDARIVALLAEGEKSLLDGDLELAKEHLVKASALAERDARIAADLAKLEATKADVEWLRVRLLAEDDPDLSTARRELELSVQRARRASDRASELAPSDPAVARSRMDALRLAGDLEGARKLVSAISGGSQPDNALVLAELDIAEAKPDWSTVIDRLRTAVSGEGNLGRARAMLVYALARSGDAAAAKAELDRLKALHRPHPLTGALVVYLARTEKTVDVSALPDAKASASKGAPATPAAREPRDRPPPPPVEPRAPHDHPSPPPPTGPIDTSDLPGVKLPPTAGTQPTAPPTPTAPPAPPPLPPGIDTSDLPGLH